MTDLDPRVAAWLAAARANAADQLDKARAHLEVMADRGLESIAEAEVAVAAVREHSVVAHTNAEEEVARWEAELQSWTSPDDEALRLAKTGALVDPHPGVTFHRATVDLAEAGVTYWQLARAAAAGNPDAQQRAADGLALAEQTLARARAEHAAYRGLAVTWALHGGPEPPPPGAAAYPPPAEGSAST